MVGNLLEIEEAMAGEHYASMRGHSIVPVLMECLSGTSIADMVAQLDKFYADHPGQISRANNTGRFESLFAGWRHKQHQAF